MSYYVAEICDAVAGVCSECCFCLLLICVAEICGTTMFMIGTITNILTCVHYRNYR